MPETTPSSCINKDPMTDWGTGTAPKLDYNIPQTNGFVANAYIPLDVNSSYFKTGAGFDLPPSGNYYDVVAGLDASTITARIANNFVAVGTPNIVNVNAEEVTQVVSVAPQYSLASLVGFESAPTSSPIADYTIAGQAVSNIAVQSLYGMPVTIVDIMGNQKIEYRQQPASAVPRITIIEHYRVDTSLGDYGAGETVKTFTLLPGEKTTISIKSYKQSVVSKKDYQNVIDSLTNDSTRELEKMLQVDSMQSTTDAGGFNLASKSESGLNIPLFGGKGSASFSGTSSNGLTMNSVRAQSIKLLTNAISKQVQKSVVSRKLDINTETSTSETSSSETSIIRVLENINKSRVLNFVFRQLNQELITITYLDDISFVYTNGYEETKQVVKIDGLLAMLKSIFVNVTDANNVFKDIVDQYYSVYDYTGTRQTFYEKRTENIYDADTGLVKFTEEYYRKNSSLAMTVDGITVNGIIKSVENRVLPSDSVIVDALLGQGEALDCFNLKLQDAAVVQANLENEAKQQAIDIIEGLTDATEKATLYKKVFSDCCDVPQIGCNCTSTSNPA